MWPHLRIRIQGFKMFVQGNDHTQIHIITQQHNMHQDNSLARNYYCKAPTKYFLFNCFWFFYLIICLVFENAMYSRLIGHLENCKILMSNQFGFRKFHSSYMVLMVLMNNLISSLERGESVVGVFLDFSKAFDTVDHVILLTKSEHYGVRGSALTWLMSYLTDRKQFVTYSGVASSAVGSHKDPYWVPFYS